MMLCRILFVLPVFTFFISLFTLESSHAATFKLPDTGQTKCYEAVSPYGEIPCAGTGQDGAYAPRNPLSYTDNGNGTITDNNTGLVWQKCSVGQNNDASCSGTAATYNWYLASGAYNASYNPTTLSVCGNLVLAGGGWRLPSKKELTGIVDYSIPYPGPTIKQSWFPSTVSSVYWSSTTGPHYPGGALAVYFEGGYLDGVGSKGFSTYVRCVRGGQ